ncbi:SH3 domain-containing protein [Rubrimonas cliftonensis]|uniref:SH3 domain-containing protein n=1 Tax=Rubrimonas cliftonensis TaxID=89524 RepID=A0A1H4BX09_9RHOB|nr:SH3 domain-containing protein [Rubrimonas cliftonensis]SEA52382.1 SH3 domain-containing protein [Rubrimonas cliftonensis]
MQTRRAALRALALGAVVAAASPVLAQHAATPASPAEGGPRRFEVSVESGTLALRAAPGSSAEVLARLTRGAVLSNLGCAPAEGRVWCDVQPMRGGPRGYAAADYLRPARGPNGDTPMGEDDSALRAGRGEFNASGTIPCAEAPEQPATPCPFGVARGTGGDATVIVTRPSGAKRAIFFIHGEAVGADMSQADGYGPFSVRREADLSFVDVGAERYELFDAIPLGG